MRKALEHLRNADPVMAGIIERVGPYRPRYMDPVFGSLVRSIVYQQLSGKVAAVIFGRLVAEAGEPLLPDAVLALGFEQMRALGLSKQKATYIRDLAEKAHDIGFDRLHRLTDDEVIERLTGVKGIGRWTAHMFLMFALRRRDILPTLDLGVRAAIKKAYGLEELPKHDHVEQLGSSWKPYRSVASWYLWRSLELQPLDESPTGRAPSQSRPADDQSACDRRIRTTQASRQPPSRQGKR